MSIKKLLLLLTLVLLSCTYESRIAYAGDDAGDPSKAAAPGINVENDVDDAKKPVYVNEAAPGQQPTARDLYELGWKLLSDNNTRAAIEIFREAVNLGSEDAKTRLSILLYQRGMKFLADKHSNPKETVKLFQESTDLGNRDAPFQLYTMYEWGLGVTKDPNKAQDWLHKAANLGNMDAQYFLGEQYSGGLNVTQDPVQSLFWYEKAAEQGHVNAQFQLARRLQDGALWGVPEDRDKAFALYRNAALQGHEAAQQALNKFVF